MKTLSIRQPWASAIVLGYKDIENREWTTNYRGPILIHAGKQADPDGYSFITGLLRNDADALSWKASLHQKGGIIGTADLVDIVTHSTSPWFQGTYGWVLKNALTLPFTPCRGQIFLFEVPDSILKV